MSDRSEVTDIDLIDVTDAPDASAKTTTAAVSAADRRRDEQSSVLEAVVVQADAPLMISQRTEADLGEGQTEVIFANDALLRLTGFERHRLLGRRPSEIFDANDGGSVFASIERSLDANFPVRQELLLRRADESTCWVDSHHFAVSEPDNERPYYVALFRDLTPALEQEHWFRSLIASVSEVVMVLDRRLVIRYLSPAVEQTLGYVPEELLGRNVRDFLRVNDRSRVTASSLQDLSMSGESRQFTVPHAEGGSRELNITVANRTDDPAIAGFILTIRDITEAQQARRELAQGTRLADAFLAAGGDAVLVVDDDGTVLQVGPTAEQVLGREAIVGAPVRDLLEPFDRMRVAPTLVGRSGDGDDIGGALDDGPLEVEIRHAERGAVPYRVSTHDRSDDPDVGGVVITLRDVSTERHYSSVLQEQAEVLELIARGEPLESTLDRLRRSLENHLPGRRAVLGVLDDADRIVHHSSPGVSDTLRAGLDGVTPDSPLGVALRTIEPGEVIADELTTELRWSQLSEDLAEGGWTSAWTMPIMARSTAALLGTMTVLGRDGHRDPDDDERDTMERAMHLAAVAIERHTLGVALAHHVLHDSTTGLPNRTLLIDRINQSLARSARRRTDVAVILVDLDHFKVINDSLGHAAGDHLLELVARRFEDMLRSGDTVGRIGGDEFVLVIDEVAGEEGAIDIAERIEIELNRPFEVAGSEVQISASLGIAVGGDDVEAEAMMRDADAAMYRAKDLGRAGHAVFEEDFRREQVDRLELERALRDALDAQEFHLQYQPLVDLRSGALVGVEALVRWARPDVGMVPPGHFIPVAEDTGLIIPIGTWVMEQACQQAMDWPPLANGKRVKMTVNLSARQLGAPGLIDVITEVLERTGMDPTALTVEVTESVLVDDVERAVATLADLKALGLSVAIDDFGTGYASLDYVRRFHDADYLKIDRSFVSGLTDFDSKDSAIVSAAIVLAKAMDFQVVAEGVETPEQLDVLRQLDCELGQGYYFAKPMDAQEIEPLILDDRNWL
jgi:diguanylate cyclase (GGDEF)-like protein/PAS domain S-box-containing protein